MAAAQALGVPAGSFEFQMLYGMADPIKDALVSMGQRVRVYTPFGQLLPGMAYLVRRLLENTANESFLRASFTEHVPEEQLLMNPSTRVRPRPVVAAKPTGLAPFANEPLADFSRTDVREAMKKALDDVAGKLGRTYSLVIDDQAITADRNIDSINPSHKAQVVGRCIRAT
nr:proline dehydrogenase [uncultured bacterium]